MSQLNQPPQRLGNILIERGMLTLERLQEALDLPFETVKALCRKVFREPDNLTEELLAPVLSMVDKNDPSKRVDVDGNYWETENSYTILVYYKSFTDQADQLIGVSNINTRSNRAGFSF